MGSYQYELPRELIAQYPADTRSGSRLLVIKRKESVIEHAMFEDLPKYLRAGDCLVVNDTRVYRARVYCRKPTGGLVELLVLRPTGREAPCLFRARGRIHGGTELTVLDREGRPAGAVLEVVRRNEDGTLDVRTRQGEPDLGAILSQFGRVPLPPYIERSPNADDTRDAERYQTVFADRVGAVAAPTAGLHFDERALRALRRKGVVVTRVTLHVGPGTFKPIRDQDIRKHTVDPEWFQVTRETVEAVNMAKEQGGRVVAVGTTVVRVLESLGTPLREASGCTDLYIMPGHEFRVVDAMLTNFHLPGSSLLVLVSAFAGRELVLRAYCEAVRERYRFYSYGDATLIL